MLREIDNQPPSAYIHSFNKDEEKEAEATTSTLTQITFAALAALSTAGLVSWLNSSPNRPALQQQAIDHPEIYKICEPIFNPSITSRIKNIFDSVGFQHCACEIFAPLSPATEKSAYDQILSNNTFLAALSSKNSQDQHLFKYLAKGAKSGSISLLPRAAAHPQGLDTLKHFYYNEGVPMTAEVNNPSPEFPFKTPLEAAVYFRQKENLEWLTTREFSLVWQGFKKPTDPTLPLGSSNEGILVYSTRTATPDFFDFLRGQLGLETIGKEEELLTSALQFENYSLARHFIKRDIVNPFKNASSFKNTIVELPSPATQKQIDEQAKFLRDLIDLGRSKSKDLKSVLLDAHDTNNSAVHWALANLHPKSLAPLLEILNADQRWEGEESILSPNTFEPATDTAYPTSAQLLPTSSNNIYYQAGSSLLKAASSNPKYADQMTLLIIDKWEQAYKIHLGEGREREIYEPISGQTLLHELIPTTKSSAILTKLLERMQHHGFEIDLEGNAGLTPIELAAKTGMYSLVRPFLLAGVDPSKLKRAQNLLHLVAGLETTDNLSKQIHASNPDLLLQKLLEHEKADPSVEGSDGNNAFELRLKGERPLDLNTLNAFIKAFESKNKIKVLAQADEDGFTPLHYLCLKSTNLNIINHYISVLKTHNLRFDQMTSDSYNAVDIAFIKKHFEIATVLLKKHELSISKTFLEEIESGTHDELLKKSPDLKAHLETRLKEANSAQEENDGVSIEVEPDDEEDD